MRVRDWTKPVGGVDDEVLFITVLWYDAMSNYHSCSHTVETESELSCVLPVLVLDQVRLLFQEDNTVAWGDSARSF